MQGVNFPRKLRKLPLLAALLCGLTLNASAFELTYQNVENFPSPDNLTVQTSSEYPWKVREDGSLQSGNAEKSSTVSAIKVTVPQAGVLRFQYKVSSSYKTDDTQLPEGALTENNPDSLVVCAGTEITTSTSYQSLPAGYQRYYGEIGWLDGSVTVDGATDVYFAYKKNASKDGGDDCAWLRDITFTQDTSVTLTAEYNSEYGTVTMDKAAYQAGDTATLTAEPKAGYQFYGWTDSAGAFLSDELTYTTKVNSDMTVKAIFAQAGAYEARRGGAFYPTLAEALANSSSGTVILLKDTTLTQSAVIPAGVTLYIPYKDHDAGAVPHTNGGNAGDDLTGTPYRTLTVPSGVTLTVNGTLRLGSVIGKSGHYYQGHTSGAHGKVVNNGTIAVSSGGTLDSWGIISGSGTVNVAGGTVCEPFIVCDFSGGSNLKSLYEVNAAPFRRYAMQNIQCTLTLDSASILTGRGNLYAAEGYNEVDIPLVSEDGLFQLADGASITRTYDAGKQLAAYPGIGRESWEVTGGMTFGALKMTVMGFLISTEDCDFPLPYNLAMTLKNGDYTIPHHLRVMPGSTLTVGRKATLTVNGSLYALDGLKQGAMSGALYPSTEQLQSGSFPANGQLVVDGGKLVIASGAAFGGVVQSTGSGSLSIAAGAQLTNTVQDGGKGYYSDNTAIFEGFTARAYIGGELTALSAGEYHATGSTTPLTQLSYTVKRVTNGENIAGVSDYEPVFATETVTINQAMNGAWAAGEAPVAEHSVTVINKTYYRDSDSTRTGVDHELNNGTLTFTVQTLDGAYTHLARVRIGESEAVTVTPDANGTYTVNGVNDDVTITVISVLKGDANLDGLVAANDATAILRYLAELRELNEYGQLAADANGDDLIAANDATRILRFSANLIPSL